MKWIRKTWVKGIFLVLCAFTATVAALCAIGLYYFGTNGYLNRSPQTLLEEMNDTIAGHLSAEILDQVDRYGRPGRGYGVIESENFHYAVLETGQEGIEEADNVPAGAEWLYRSPGFEGFNGWFFGFAGERYHYRNASLTAMVSSEPELRQLDNTLELYGPEALSAEAEELSRIYVVYRIDSPLRESEFWADQIFRQSEELAEASGFFTRTALSVQTVALLLTLLLLGVLLSVSGRRVDQEGVFLRAVDRIPYALAVLLCLAPVPVSVLFFQRLNPGLLAEYLSFGAMLLYLGSVLFLSALAAIALLMTTAVRLKARSFWRTTLLYRSFCLIRSAGQYLSAHGRPLYKIILFLAVLTFLEGCFMRTDLETVILAFLLYKIAAIPLVLYLTVQFEDLREGGRRLAAGDLSQPVKKKYMSFSMRDFAEDLDRTGDGLQAAVSEQMKSERMKTELITNVSHDIKTPLTSIINYVDLLEKEAPGEGKLREYAEVLHRQSVRLKKLLEDLIETSKAVSGSLACRKESLDLSVLLTQILGEYEERLKAAGLETVVKKPEGDVPVEADSRHLFRVLDNLLSNICKYALADTRVYVTLEGGDALTLTFRNISREPLGEDWEELTERFVRGDRSRSTEGSGLGLSIARSLMERMGGKLRVEVDGDLFKAVIDM